MIRKIMPAGVDPMGEDRLFEKIMLHPKVQSAMTIKPKPSRAHRGFRVAGGENAP